MFKAGAMSDLPALMAYVDGACAESGVGDEAAFAVRLAVEEAFTNIMEHGYSGDGGPVAVVVDADARRVRILLRDEAAAFDPLDVPAPDLDAPLEDREPGGLGWHLVRQVMDEVRHEPVAPRGNLLTLVKRLPVAAPEAQGGER